MRLKSTGVTCGNGKILSVLTGIGLALAPGICQAQAPATYNISTIAGTPGTGGFSGDGGPANTAQLNGPCALAVDNVGNLYIADSLNYRVRKMAIGGNINTVVGTGTAGDTTGTATSSQIRNACGLLLDSSGNLYVADTTNHEVKKVSGGTLSTIAGTGTAGFNLDGNPAVKAQMNNPTGLALNGGVLFIADTYNQRVRHIDTGGIIQTVVGTGTQGYLGDGGPAIGALLSNPQGLAMDAAGNLYIADTDNSVIRKVPPDFSTISTVAGNGIGGYSGDGGLATQAKLNNPKDVAVDAAGNLYIADTINSRIRVVTPDGIIHTIAGNGTPGYGGDGGLATLAQLKFPDSVKVDSAGNVYIADTQNQVIRQLTPVPTGPPSVTGVQSSSLFGFGGSSAVAPGSWIEVHGSNLAGESRSWLLADFNGVVAPTSLELTSVTIGGQFAAIASISSSMLLVQVPSQVGTGPQPLVVTTGFPGTTSPFTVTVNALEPGVYAPPFLSVGGNQYTSEFNDFMEWVLPTGAVAGTNSRPARSGDFIVVWGVGFGPVTTNVPTGTIVQGLTTLTTPVQFSIGGVPATVLYQGLAPGEIGLYQFDLVVPNNVAAGNLVPLTFTQGGVSGTQKLFVAIQP